MSMSEDIRENDELEAVTSVELEDEAQEAVVEASPDSETRTNVRKKSNGDDELENYSEGVQKRINQLTAKRKQASEEAQAAVQYARQVQQQNEQMKVRLAQLDKGYRTEYEGRIVSQEAQAKKALTEAHEAGDYERVADAQSAISQVAIEKERLRVQKAKAAQSAQQEKVNAQQQQQQQQQQQPQPQQRQDPRLEKWLSNNDWFGKDRILTRAAQAIHEQLVLEEDYDPSSSDYYTEIDQRIRREMPNKFQSKQRSAQVVTPASGNGRSLKSGRKRSVELTPGQVAFANKMRIPLEVYAKEVVKIESRSE
mgnify:FL=1